MRETCAWSTIQGKLSSKDFGYLQGANSWGSSYLFAANEEKLFMSGR